MGGGTSQQRLQGLRERAVLLGILGFVLWLPPLVLVVDHRGTVFGAPVFYVYIFMVWGGLILLNGVLARRLGEATRAVELLDAADLSDEAPVPGGMGARLTSGTGTPPDGEPVDRR